MLNAINSKLRAVKTIHTLLTGTADNFCPGNPELCNTDMDNASMRHATGFCAGSTGNSLYVLCNSAEGPRLYGFDKSLKRRTNITVCSGTGSGEWKAIAIGVSPKDLTKKCLVILEVGRKGGEARLIYIDEPTDAELKSGSIVKEGTEYLIQYSATKCDSETLVLSLDSVLVLAKRGRKTTVYVCPTGILQHGVTTLEPTGELLIGTDITSAFTTKKCLVVRTQSGLNFYSLIDLYDGMECDVVGQQKFEAGHDAVAYDARSQIIYTIHVSSKKLHSIRFVPPLKWSDGRAQNSPPPLNIARADTAPTLQKSPSTIPEKVEKPKVTQRPPEKPQSGNFCLAQPQLLSNGDQLDTGGMKEATGMCTSSNGKYFYVLNDTLQGGPRIFAFEKETLKRTVIEISGLRQTGYNPPDRNAEGYGDWKAIALGNSPAELDKKCIIVADIGHSKSRNEGRSDDQQTRLIYVEEPTESELTGRASVSKACVEYPIQYSDKNLKLDAEALVVAGDSILICTKNPRDGNKKCYVYVVPNVALQSHRVTSLECTGEMAIQFSVVTDAFATSKYLALRTNFAINFYALGDLYEGLETECRGYQKLSDLNESGGVDTVTCEAQSQTIYFLGVNKKKLHSLQFNPSDRPRKFSPPQRTMTTGGRTSPTSKTRPRRASHALPGRTSPRGVQRAPRA